MKSVYLIGSLRNEKIPEIAKSLRDTGLDVFDDWYAAGPEADDYWKKYSEERGHSYKEALNAYAAQHVFGFDKHHLNRVDGVILALPAGKSGHMELGYAIGIGKRGFVLLDSPDRWDVMYAFAEKVFFSVTEMVEFFKNDLTKEALPWTKTYLYPDYWREINGL